MNFPRNPIYNDSNEGNFVIKHKITKVIRGLYLLPLLVMVIMLEGCEDVIDVDVKAGESQLVVDGWIYNNTDKQKIKFTMTHGYFESSSSPAAQSLSEVQVVDDAGNKYDFIEEESGSGLFSSNFKGEIGRHYTLSLKWNDQSFSATTSLKRVPPIDSLYYQYLQKSFGWEGGYAVLFYARDIKGTGDYYRLKTFRKNKGESSFFFYNDADEIFTIDDKNSDGMLFIYPARIYFTREPYEEGDWIKTVVESIDENANGFLEEINEQAGNVGLFASPVSNVKTNIINSDPSSLVKAVGWFGASAVSEDSVLIGDKSKERVGVLDF